MYEFADFQIDAIERRLLRNGNILAIKPKLFDLLVLLATNSGHVIDKPELMRQLRADCIRRGTQSDAYCLRVTQDTRETGERL